MFALRIGRINLGPINYKKQYHKCLKYYANSENIRISTNWNQKLYSHTGTTSNYQPKFIDVIQKRRKEAARSILVQVNSSRSNLELYSYCSQYGKIKNMFHYTTCSDPLHFIIVEFDNENAVSNIIDSSSHVSNNDTETIPVTSQFLWFRAIGKQKSSKTVSATSNKLPISFIENGTKIFSQEDIESLLHNAQNISDQMTLLYKMTCLSDTGTRVRFLASRQIELALSGMFPNAQALPFGSSVNSYGKEGCDLDLVVCLNTKKSSSKNRLAFHSKAALSNERSQTQRHMECIADMLQLFLPGCVNVRRILQARVPIIKYNQEQTGLECDLSMTNLSGVYMSDLLYTLGCIDPRVKPLVFTVRRWAQQVGLTTNSPGRWITNFGLTLMVLSFLQKVQILPSVNTLMKLAESCDKMTFNDINCSFLHDLSKLPEQKNPNKDSLEILLLQFFEHFSSFDFYNRAVSLNEGKDIHKPESCALYIVNPLERYFNVSKNVSTEEMERLRIEFRNAAWTLESQDSSKFKATPNWGLLELFKSQKVKTKNIFFTAPVQNRLLEVKRLFEDDDINDKIEYKNEAVKKEIKKIKMDTADKVDKVISSIKNKSPSKIRIRRR